MFVHNQKRNVFFTPSRILLFLLIITLLLSACEKKPDEKKKAEVDSLSISIDNEDQTIHQTPNQTSSQWQKGSGTITISEKDLAVEPEIVEVSPDKPLARFKCGVIVDFGECTLNGKADLEVRDLGDRADNDFEMVAYDFKLGDAKSFPSLIRLELPYPEDWEEGEIFTQYYNPGTSSWERIYCEVDPGQKKTIVYTDHFSTYSISKRLGSFWSYKPGEDDPLFIHEKRGSQGLTPLTRVYLNEANARKLLSKTPNDKAFQLLTAHEKNFMQMMEYVTGQMGSKVSIAEKTLDFTTLTKAFPQETANLIGNKFAAVGVVLATAQMATSWYNTGSLSEAVKKNYLLLSETAFSLAAIGMSGPCGAVCAAMATATWMMSMYVDHVKDKRFQQRFGGKDDPEYYAYRTFTQHFLDYNTRTNRFEYNDGANLEQMLNHGYGESFHLDTRNKAGWTYLLERIEKRYWNKPEQIMSAVNDLFHEYLTYFWRISKRTRNNFFERTEHVRPFCNKAFKLADVYRTPTKDKINNYIAIYRREVFNFLSPIIKELIDRAMAKIRNIAYEGLCQLEKEFNQVLTFQLVDPLYKNYADSPMSQMIAAIADEYFLKKTNHALVFNMSKGYTTQITLYNYFYVSDAPRVVRFYSAEEWAKDPKIRQWVKAVRFTADIPRTQVVVHGLELEDLQGTWEVTGTHYGWRASGKRIVNTYKSFWKKYGLDHEWNVPDSDDPDQDPYIYTMEILPLEDNKAALQFNKVSPFGYVPSKGEAVYEQTKNGGKLTVTLDSSDFISKYLLQMGIEDPQEADEMILEISEAIFGKDSKITYAYHFYLSPEQDQVYMRGEYRFITGIYDQRIEYQSEARDLLSEQTLSQTAAEDVNNNDSDGIDWDALEKDPFRWISTPEEDEATRKWVENERAKQATPSTVEEKTLDKDNAANGDSSDFYDWLYDFEKVP